MKTTIIISAVIGFFFPIKWLLFLVGLAIIADTAVAVYLAKKCKIPVTSRKLSRIARKMIIYQLILLSVYPLDYFLVGEFALLFVDIPIFLTKIAALLLIGIEVYSIDETMRKRLNGQGIVFYIKKLISLKNKIDNELEDIDDEPEKPIDL